jgi:hypothetical protein
LPSANSAEDRTTVSDLAEALVEEFPHA